MNRPSLLRSSQWTLALLGAVLGGIVLLFGIANSRFVVISIPAPLTQTSTAIPVFEARLWAVMLVSFAFGVALTAGIAVHYYRNARRSARRAEVAEAELSQARRLLASLHGKG